MLASRRTASGKQCWSGGAAVFVDESAEDVNPFDACVRIGARLDWSSGDRTSRLMPRWGRFSWGRPELEVAISVFVQLKG